MQRRILIYLSLGIMLWQCNSDGEKLSEAYLNDLETWKEDRVKDLKAEDGFLNLAGLYWLSPGKNTFGSDSANNQIGPDDMPGVVGTFYVENAQVYFKAAPDAKVTNEGEPVDSLMVYDTTPSSAKNLETGTFSWLVINRAGNYGIRLRNLDHPVLKEPLEIPYFPTSANWQVEATYHPYSSPKAMKIQNIVGFEYEEEVPGQLEFSINDTTYTLEPTSNGKKLFIMFSDQTNALETYGGGRYLYADLPDDQNKVTIDFNKAYNPPCAFTAFATCPLPPAQNRLKVRIPAGEKNYHEM